MNRQILAVVLGCALLSVAVIFIADPGNTAGGPAYHSPLSTVLSPDGKTLFVSDHTAGAVVFVDADKGEVAATLAVPEPNGLTLSPDGKTLYAASGSLDRVYEIDTERKTVRGTIGVGRQPVGMALSPDGKTLYCCNQFTDDVSVIDVGEMVVTKTIKAIREPRFAALAQDGKTLVIANHLPLGSNLDETLGANVTIVDLADGATTNVQLSRGATDVGQVCVSSDGRWAYVVHVLARWLIPPTQLDRGWVATNALTIIDVQNRKRLNTVLLDDLDRGAANPFGISLSGDGSTLYVSHSGVNEIQIIDTAKLHKLVNEWPADSPTELENDLTAVYRAGVRQRVKCGGLSPRGVAAADDGVFVANYFSGTVTRLKGAKGKVAATISLGDQPEMDIVRRGEYVFNDGVICFQGWQSCATCHPDGRTDGLAWDLLNDDIGNPKNAKSLLLSGPTPPVMGSGIRATMRVAVDAGFKFILFHVPTEDEINAAAAYIDDMKPARSPFCNPDGSLSAAAKRGKQIYERADVGCARCHPAPLYTDLKMYDVGTRHEYDHRSDFDTPTLVEMFRSAPYLHDGSAVTMHEVLVDHNKKDEHGATTHLSEQEVQDLAEYVMSL